MFILGRRIEDVKVAFVRRTNLQHAGHVTTPIAVVWRAPHCTEQIVKQHLISFVAELVRAQNMALAVKVQKFAHYLRTKCIACAPRTQTKLVLFGIWVTPYKIRHGPFMGYLAEAIDDLDLIDAVN